MDGSRACFVAAGGVFALFAGDVLAAKAQMLFGASMPVHMGETLQFFVLLVAVTLFVAGTLVREGREMRKSRDADTANDIVQKTSTQGSDHP
ncbi:MAG: hypothetical protein COW30_09960 [Rhodospirillales bacterium CG15_BIG_FIL_POST_REV_8_21_14_020_66_15]|nr:MAG: hypothetical protein COW30_09960 [Rhodospirillales bacterium CG15_BIG_FIL_POST_REV_8_21_14_020_66_15]